MKNNFVSGEWSGFYLEGHRQERGWMHLFMAFEEGKIRGEGTDYVGPWVATGTYDESSGKCGWVKQYVGKHTVEYKGVCGENGIQGNWQIFSKGQFHIWPRNHPQYNELYLRDELENPVDMGRSILLEPVTEEEFE